MNSLDSAPCLQNEAQESNLQENNSGNGISKRKGLFAQFRAEKRSLLHFIDGFQRDLSKHCTH